MQKVQQHIKSILNTLGWGRKEKGRFNHDATIFAKTDLPSKKSNIIKRA